VCVCVCVPISVATRPEAEAFLRLLSGIARSSPTGDMDVSCECYMWSGEVFVTGRFLVERIPTECGVLCSQCLNGETA